MNSVNRLQNLLICILNLFLWPTLFAGEKPNVILVMADDQGWGDVGFRGHPHLRTPEMDRMAREGLVFERFYAASSVCSPTRGSVMTGRHPNRFGCFSWGHTLRPQEQTIAELFRSVGYRTGHFGKWHLGSVQSGSPVNPGASGFDEWVSAPNFYDTGAILSNRGRAIKTFKESSVQTAELASDFISRCNKNNEAFLAVVWFGSPHSPHAASERDIEAYRGLPRAEQNFLGEITGIDRALAQLRQTLESNNIREKTLVWYCSDNGSLPKVGNSGKFRGKKGSLYEGGVLVPSMIEWPKVIKRPKKIFGRANTSDIFPTLARIIGASGKISHTLDGMDLSSVISGQEFKLRPKDMGFWKFPIRGIGTPSQKWMQELLNAQRDGNDPLDPLRIRPKAGIIDKTYPENFYFGHSTWISKNLKIHRIQKKGSEKIVWELYDLDEDPYERQNLLNKEATEPFSKEIENLKNKLLLWQKSVIESLNGNDYPQTYNKTGPSI